MTYAVELTRSARKDLLALDHPVYERVAMAIDRLQENPRPDGAGRLRTRQHAWRLLVADYRVLYEVDDQSGTITIYRVRHRREVYR